MQRGGRNSACLDGGHRGHRHQPSEESSLESRVTKVSEKPAVALEGQWPAVLAQLTAHFLLSGGWGVANREPSNSTGGTQGPVRDLRNTWGWPFRARD